MRSSRIRNILRFLVVFLVLSNMTMDSWGQATDGMYLPAYDERPIHYGFLIALHSSIYKLEYSDTFLDSLNLHSIMPKNSAGFSLGFVGNLRLGKYFDFRVTPTVGFYELKVDYNFVNSETIEQAVSSTNVEIPLLLKYKSERRKNLRMFLVGGVKATLEASGRKDDEEVDKLRTKNSNLFIEFGFGLDIYYPLFKFSPEIRFSRGLINVLTEDENRFTSSIDRLAVNTITLLLVVQ